MLCLSGTVLWFQLLPWSPMLAWESSSWVAFGSATSWSIWGGHGRAGEGQQSREALWKPWATRQTSRPAHASNLATKAASACDNVSSSPGCHGRKPWRRAESWQSIPPRRRSSLRQVAQPRADLCLWHAAEQAVSGRLIFALGTASWKSKALLTYREDLNPGCLLFTKSVVVSKPWRWL